MSNKSKYISQSAQLPDVILRTIKKQQPTLVPIIEALDKIIQPKNNKSILRRAEVAASRLMPEQYIPILKKYYEAYNFATVRISIEKGKFIVYVM